MGLILPEFFMDPSGSPDGEGTAHHEDSRYPGMKEQVEAQVRMIEVVHGVRLVNRDLLIKEIMIHASDPGEVSRITAAINAWVAVQGSTGDTEVPHELPGRLLAETREESLP